MKKNIIITTAAAFMMMMTVSSCKKYLDINSDPDTPQNPDASSVFPAMLGNIPRGLQYDGRYASKYVQNFGANTSANVNNFDRQGYNSGSDVNGDIWRQCYFGLGANLDYIIAKGTLNSQWDYVGAAQVLKAMMFQYATDYHGEIIFSEAFVENKAFFKYDDQERIYAGIDSILKVAMVNLGRTDLGPTATRLSKADYSYAGNTSRWIKLAWGLRARNAHRITNKSFYNADSVIAFCNRSLETIDDDFLIPFDAQKNDDANFFGPYRDNLTLYRQSDFIVRLLEGSTLTGTPATKATAFNRDPRMRHMLSSSQDTAMLDLNGGAGGNGGYRGVAPATGDPNSGSTTGLFATRRIPVPWLDSFYVGNPSLNVFGAYRKYLFGDKVVMPVMTASEIQFMKAEAAFRKGDAAMALTAYTAGINLHFDFINRTTFPKANAVLYNGSPISATERSNYLNGNNVKRSTATLTLTDIMLQKYIALWGWGFYETFVDMRRYHWTDLDPLTGQQVYKTLVLPNPLFADNLGKPVYRVRPRYNSEYVWNRDELLRIGGLNVDYHTYEPWFSKP